MKALVRKCYAGPERLKGKEPTKQFQMPQKKVKILPL